MLASWTLLSGCIIEVAEFIQYKVVVNSFILEYIGWVLHSPISRSGSLWAASWLLTKTCLHLDVKSLSKLIWVCWKLILMMNYRLQSGGNSVLISMIWEYAIHIICTGNPLERAYFVLARFMGPTRGPPGADRTQVGRLLDPWTLLSVLANLLCNTKHALRPVRNFRKEAYSERQLVLAKNQSNTVYADLLQILSSY